MSQPHTTTQRRGTAFRLVRLPWSLLGLLRSLLGPGAAVRQSLAALGMNSSTSIVAGIFLGTITGTLEQLPGLLILVPAAIGLRGNVFSTFGNRLSTSIHIGQFEMTWRRDSVLMQNVFASLILTVALSMAIAVLARVIAVAVGVDNGVGLMTLVMISVLGGVLASAVVLAATIGLAWAGARRGWDLDNVVAPVVSTLGDVLTLPALWVAAQLAGVGIVAPVLGVLMTLVAVGAFVYGVWSPLPLLRRVTRESWPILLLAASLSTMAGLVLQQRLGTLAAFPVLLVLQPAFVSSAGALGGVLSSRLSSKLHLGVVDPVRVPQREVLNDASSVLLLGLPVYLFNAVAAYGAARLAGLATGPALSVLGVSLVAGFVTVVFVIAVAYYGTAAAVVMRVDPDTYGIPIVTSSVDFVGSVALVAVAVAFGFTAT